MIKSIAAVALVAFGALTVACGEDTSQPDVAEAYASDLTDGTSTDTDPTEPAAETAPAKTPEQADQAEAPKARRSELHSSDRIESKPLKGE